MGKMTREEGMAMIASIFELDTGEVDRRYRLELCMECGNSNPENKQSKGDVHYWICDGCASIFY
jgi:hypothetical protein